jgi:hypothetical protein
VLLSVIFKKPAKEPWFYLFGQVLVFGCLITISVSEWIKDAKHDRQFGNIEHNHSLVELDNKDESHSWFTKDQGYIKVAFRKLESGFTDPNSFHLTSFFTRKRDTTVTSYSDTIYSVYFSYEIAGKKEMFSKVSVFENKASIDIFNQGVESNGDYRKLKHDIDESAREVFDSAKKAIDELPDSIKRKIRKAIGQ